NFLQKLRTNSRTKKQREAVAFVLPGISSLSNAGVTVKNKRFLAGSTRSVGPALFSGLTCICSGGEEASVLLSRMLPPRPRPFRRSQLFRKGSVTAPTLLSLSLSAALLSADPFPDPAPPTVSAAP